ncbi:hypothetical protein POJ06DRAFT_247999 [Lipomyces tetrasporus]|uniref:Uncharacterized protein n=1 Tax=Lipomyces tetrasporus TaxID=54092 RepID=A0AAD7QVA8_9ASCO|nr:uncharacterized protein POJ06DRAFT_247999 [Lipomyces tetrasporus]KAJ8101836.1 hypothetical protein POJ06DRAFT_247999 [Lipomyces tetrasporus]
MSEQPRSSSKPRHYGRGGAGNITTQPESTSSPAPVQVFTSPNQTFHSGRGGYGNVQSVDTLPAPTPDEYLKEVDEALEVREGDVFKIGRGGSGNILVEGEGGKELHTGEARRSRSRSRSRTRTPQNVDGSQQADHLSTDNFFSRIGRRLSHSDSKSRESSREAN